MLKRLVPYAALFMAVHFLIRLTLFARSINDVVFLPAEVGEVFLRGVWMDAATVPFCLLPVALVQLFVPLGNKPKVERGLRFVFAYAVMFGAVAEHVFWTEFSARFNFIAVDYLVYTHEVVGNIVESYPLGWLLLGIGVLAAGAVWWMGRVWPCGDAPRFGRKLKEMGVVLALCGGLYVASDVDQAHVSENALANELAGNGVYSLFSAFWHNEINYDQFYTRDDEHEVKHEMRALLDEENSEFIGGDHHDTTRIVHGRGKETRKNVVMVVMESMSANYMGRFGNEQGLTPNLDRLAGEGLFFTHMLATGTRTVRGLEALSLSIPPTPGQSIIRRKGNENLFSLGFVFQDRGYKTQFIYGGYGYFDNMSPFFSANGFEVIDRANVPEEQVHFANVWGICDEDMFARALLEADKAYAEKKPFFQMIMTTSNHRPYTYPDGRIDIAPHSGRLGGVKYADYSVGKLVEWAREKPWFKDTVFVFVADHTAGAGGKVELDEQKYHIPLIFYAPGFVKPARFEALASQIDVAPMLLGLLNFTYVSKFYGEDLLHDEDERPHAFVSNFQKVAMIEDGKLTVLAPRHAPEQLVLADQDKHIKDVALVKETVAYYQSASWWRRIYQRVPTLVP